MWTYVDDARATGRRARALPFSLLRGQTFSGAEQINDPTFRLNPSTVLHISAQISCINTAPPRFTQSTMRWRASAQLLYVLSATPPPYVSHWRRETKDKCQL